MAIIHSIIIKFFGSLQTHYWKIVYKSYRRKYKVPDSFWFGGESIQFYGEGAIEIGENSYIGRYSSIYACKGYKVKIGNNVAISHYVMIYTENNLADQDFNLSPKKTNKANVEIGDACWIGAKVFIKEGVKIGSNCVIGANSVVIKDMPDNSICSGIPAKVIRFKNI
ncbi:acyltransferase [Pedobacter hiemivivus]|uniref:Acyltransferase n=1 Tax=Pedobacter hiemivivus TaxID=2530454 RepID=A0A4U1G2C2_9SPHI|nr:acyltransferase [Pedobacter hiemivivus]TKC56949.1 acyltransferase [Pedobacter hiemivivus]